VEAYEFIEAFAIIQRNWKDYVPHLKTAAPPGHQKGKADSLESALSNSL
jgi:hypothetical protein